MSNIFEKFNKIWVNNSEIDLLQLESNKGKYHIDNYQIGDGNVNVKFQLKENEKIIPGIFDGNEQIKNIILSYNFNIEIENGSFAGLDLTYTSKQAISEIVGEEVFEPTEPEEPKTYTVIFKNDEETIKTVTGKTGTTVELPDALEKEGYEFKGWSIDGTTVILPIANIGEEDVVYLAVWTEAEEEPEFIPKTVYFISYGDDAGTIEYARGSVETTNVTKDGKTKVTVLTNTIEGWNTEFYVDSAAEEGDNQLYQLYTLQENNSLTAIDVWVKLFSTSQIPEEPTTPEEPEFIPKTIHFISYGDDAGTIEYARGSVETTNVTKDGKTKVTVLTNTIEEWKNLEFYVDSAAEEGDNQLYQLFKLENDALTAIDVWVKLFSTSQIPEEPTEPEFTPKTVYFISYGDNAGTIEYARGSVETTNVTKDGKTKVTVLTNTIEGWNTEFYVDSAAEEGDNQLYQLYTLQENDALTAIDVWVKLFSTSQIPEEPTEPEFVPQTVYFISYGDNAGTIEYARGSVETTNVTKDGKTKVTVLTNTIEEWKNLEFYVDSTAEEDDNQLYQLFKLENDALTAIDVWVKLFSTEQASEEPIEQFYFSIGQEEVTNDNYTTVNNVQLVTEYPSEVQEFTPETGNENVYILVKNDKTIVVTQPNVESTIINTLVEEININDEYKVVHYNKITGSINIQIN